MEVQAKYMAWKVKSNVKIDRLYKVGEVIQSLDDEVAIELEKLGAIENLDGSTAQPSSPQQATPSQDPNEDPTFERGQVDQQMAEHVQNDMADNQKIAETPGVPVENNQPRPGVPSNDEVAATAAGVQ